MLEMLRIRNLPEAGSKTGPRGRAAEMDKCPNLRLPGSSEVSGQSLWGLGRHVSQLCQGKEHSNSFQECLQKHVNRHN